MAAEPRDVRVALPGPRSGLSWVRIVTAGCVGAVLVAATASSLVWASTPPPSPTQLEQAVAELTGADTALADVSELSVDSTGLGPRQLRGTFPAALPLDDTGIERIQASARHAGWQTTVFRDPDGTFVRATKGDLVADVSRSQIDLATMVPLAVNVAVAVGGVLGVLLGCWLSLRRQRRDETLRGQRWRRAVASGLLPPFAVLTAALPVYAVLSGAARTVGDYGSLTVGVLILFAGLWVPVAVLIAAAVWFWSGRRAGPSTVRS